MVDHKKDEMGGSLPNQLLYIVLRPGETTEDKGIRQDVLTMEVTPDIGESIVVSGLVGDLGTIVLPTVSRESKEWFTDFTGRSKKYLFHIPYACPTGTTFHPFLFRAVVAYLQEKQPKQGMDYALLVELQNHVLLSLDTIKSYIHDVDPTVDVAMMTERQELWRVFTTCLTKTQSREVPKKSPTIRVQSHESKLI